MRSTVLAPLVLAVLVPFAAAQTAKPAAPGLQVPSAAPGGFLGGTDDCTTPLPIFGQGTFSFDNSAATTGTEGQVEAECYAFGSTVIDNDVWYCWTADADGCVELSTCGLTAVDTKIAAYPGCGCPANGTALVCNDDACGFQSTITWPVTNGTTYTIQLGTFPGLAGGTGQFTMTIAPCPVPAPVEIVGHYKLDEAMGPAAVDSSPNGFDGVWMGGVTYGLPGADAATGSSVELDDTLQGHALFPGNAVWDAMDRDLSVAAWIRPQSYGQPIGISRVFGNVLGSWTCGITSGGLRFTTSGIQDYDQPATVPLDEWTHVAYVFDIDFDVTFYVDGVNIGTLAGNGPANPASAEWRIGSWDANIEYWDGQLDEVQVYRGALSDAQVQFLFNNPGAVAMDSPGTPLCFGDGSGGICACGNTSAPGAGEGCSNSSGVGGLLASSGMASLASDTMVITATNLLPGQPCLMFQGAQATNGGNGITFGDGLRCCGTDVRRLVTLVPDAGGCAASDASCGTPAGGNAGPISQNPNNPGLQPGDSRCYQAWYRDPIGGPCGTGFNLSNAQLVLWGA